MFTPEEQEMAQRILGGRTEVRVYMVHYKDKAGVTQRVRVVALTREAAKRRVENREGVGCVKSIEAATSAEKIKPLAT